eukprot:2729391-Pyramimonas_sp.AAC.1
MAESIVVAEAAQGGPPSEARPHDALVPAAASLPTMTELQQNKYTAYPSFVARVGERPLQEQKQI